MYYDPRIRQKEQSINYAKGKTKQVAWFVSNCNAKNNRLELARTLQNYIGVDIYGYCGNLTCPRHTQADCLQVLKENYKFYLSFENSNCKDYVTEKFFETALSNNVIPIVMGGSPDDYHKIAPEGSFIHVDEFESIEHLAKYLKLLDEDDELYNTYFKWIGTGEIINHYYWCRVCAMLHVPNKDRQFTSLSNVSFRDWWQGDNVCNKANWKKFS